MALREERWRSAGFTEFRGDRRNDMHKKQKQALRQAHLVHKFVWQVLITLARIIWKTCFLNMRIQKLPLESCYVFILPMPHNIRYANVLFFKKRHGHALTQLTLSTRRTQKSTYLLHMPCSCCHVL